MLSIVSGTYNRLSILPQLVDNTVEAYENLELILLEGGSGDGSVDYIKKLKHPRIKLIEIGKRSAWPSFMNIGIRHASYDWIVQWNDDVILRNSWEEVIKVLDDHKAYAFSWNRCGDPGNCLAMDKTTLNFGIIHRSIFEEIGMYDPSFRFYGGDTDLTSRINIFDYPFKLCPEIWVEETVPPMNTDTYTGQDDSIVFANRNLYKQGIIPDRIPKLEKK